jgi:hypothetical protein
MDGPYYVQVLASNRANGPALASWTVAKSVINAADLYQLPLNWCKIGTKFRIRVAGSITTVGTTSGTVTFQMMMGAVVVWTSGPVQLTTTAEATGQSFVLEAVVRVTAVDAVAATPAGTLLGQGWVAGLVAQLGAGAAVGLVTDSIIMVPATAAANGTAFGSSATENVDFWIGFSTAGNTALIQDYVLEQLQ